jgi:hypothetical protein
MSWQHGTRVLHMSVFLMLLAIIVEKIGMGGVVYTSMLVYFLDIQCALNV